MIQLERIIRNGDTVACDIYPEGSRESGHLEVNIKTGEGEYTLPDGYEYCSSHANHAALWLRENAKAKSAASARPSLSATTVAPFDPEESTGFMMTGNINESISVVTIV